MDQVRTVGEKMHRRQDEGLNLFRSCKQQYNRIYSKLEEAVYRAYRQVEDAESMQRSAELEYEAARRSAETAEDEEAQNAALQKMQRVQEMRADAAQQYAQASAAYSGASGNLKSFSAMWEKNAPTLEAQANRVEDGMASFLQLVSHSNSDLGEYMSMMEQSQAALYDSVGDRTAPDTGNPNPTNSAGRSVDTAGTGRTAVSGETGDRSADLLANSCPTGWCTSTCMTAVRVNGDGKKMVSITIGGVARTYPCTKSGMAKAYRQAKMSGDEDMIARTSAMFEIETLREDLELGRGEEGYAQLGGYHKDVKRQDPTGYESHHIPSQGAQDEDAAMLPTISITHENHKHTSSFAGRQSKTYHSVFSPNAPQKTYKEAIIQNLEQGGPGYIDSVRNELLDLRSATGHRYDGGVSAYLDAVIDMLSTRGIPKAKSGGSE